MFFTKFLSIYYILKPQNAYTYMYIALAYEHFVSQGVRTLEGPCLTPLYDI